MSELPLDSLLIRRFRCFEDLEIEKLGRVNLFVGRNNVGKTALLEAIWLYAAGFGAIKDILALRQENLDSRFYNPQPEPKQVRKLFFDGKVATPSEERISFEIGSLFDSSKRISFLSTFRGDDGVSYNVQQSLDDAPKVHFVAVSRLKHFDSDVLWDEIELTEAEDDIVEALKIIDDRIIKVRPKLLSSNPPNNDKVILVQLKGEVRPRPLKSLGEGLNRLFEIALILARSKNGIVLIDEIEIGLHYSILSDIWKLVFKIARDLNVQVFATTHSYDCLEAFTTAAIEDKDSDGVLIRLEKKLKKIEAIAFSEDELESVTRRQIEVR